jgi:hypothetical protein
MNTTFLSGIAATTLEEVLRPRHVGEQVVSHVLDNVVEPRPDFDAMRRLVAGELGNSQAALPKPDRDRQQR